MYLSAMAKLSLSFIFSHQKVLHVVITEQLRVRILWNINNHVTLNGNLIDSHFSPLNKLTFSFIPLLPQMTKLGPESERQDKFKIWLIHSLNLGMKQ